MALLELKQLGKTNQLQAIELEIEKGQCVVLQCNNHTAKVLHRIIIGEEEASTGSVLFDGEPIRKQFYSRIGFCFLKDEAYDRLKVKEYFAFLFGLYGSNISIKEVVQYVSLLDKMNVKIEKLSFSEKRRLHIGRVMIHNPDLIIFEEPETKCRYRKYNYHSKSNYEDERTREGHLYYILLFIGCTLFNGRCVYTSSRWC